MAFSRERRPLIGITTGAARAKDGLDYVRLRTTYIKAVDRAGGLPVLVPPLEDATPLFERLDGLLLPGGADVDPVFYGEPMNGTVSPNPELDRLELDAARWAVQHELPMLGICRGQQVVNVALGGSLVQHMEGHAPEGARDWLHHGFRVAPESQLAAVLGGTSFEVNSHHHQAVKELGEGLVAVAWADDGTIEGVERASDDGWLLAVQFHPEDLLPEHEASKRLLEAFVEACCAVRSHPPGRPLAPLDPGPPSLRLR
jgi:putative glutamine amidotransferase